MLRRLVWLLYFPIIFIPQFLLTLMNRTFILSLTIAVFPLVTCYGQTTAVAVVKGLVINAFTGEPLSYATVSLSKKVLRP